MSLHPRGRNTDTNTLTLCPCRQGRSPWSWYRLLSASFLLQAVQLDVMGQDDMSAVWKSRRLSVVIPSFLMQISKLFDQRLSWPPSRFRLLKFSGKKILTESSAIYIFPVDYNCMASIVTRLTSNHFSMAERNRWFSPFFISPLGSYNNNWCRNFVWAARALPFLNHKAGFLFYKRILHFIIRKFQVFGWTVFKFSFTFESNYNF